MCFALLPGCQLSFWDRLKVTESWCTSCLTPLGFLPPALVLVGSPSRRRYWRSQAPPPAQGQRSILRSQLVSKVLYYHSPNLWISSRVQSIKTIGPQHTRMFLIHMALGVAPSRGSAACRRNLCNPRPRTGKEPVPNPSKHPSDPAKGSTSGHCG